MIETIVITAPISEAQYEYILNMDKDTIIVINFKNEIDEGSFTFCRNGVHMESKRWGFQFLKFLPDKGMLYLESYQVYFDFDGKDYLKIDQ